MALAHARALIADLDVVEADPIADLAALRKLAGWCLRYAPLTAADVPNGLWIDATGCAHIFHGEAAMVSDLVQRLARAGISARAAIADTPGAAHAVARFASNSGVVVVETGQTREALRSLPIAALRLPRETVDALRRLGFDRIEQLWATPRAPLALRFGAEIGRRLDQALGVRFEPIEPVFPRETARRHMAFAEPISTPEALSRAICNLTARLCETLEAGGFGARRLDLLCQRIDGSHQAVRVGTARPSRDAAHLARLLSERIETIDPGFGVEVMTLSASLVEPLSYAPAGSLLDARARVQDLSALVDCLANRFGLSRLYRATLAESDLPERSIALVPPLDPPRGMTWDPALPRPSRLLSPPESVETTALLPDHPPALFVWRGARHRIRRMDGPERIYGEWWRSDAETESIRDYYRVEDETGLRFWLFRAGLSNEARWFLHGLFG